MNRMPSLVAATFNLALLGGSGEMNKYDDASDRWISECTGVLVGSELVLVRTTQYG